MDLSRLRPGETIAAAGGLLLLLGLFLPWYATEGNGRIGGRAGSLSGWQVHDLLRWALVLAALAPFILVYIVLRDHELSWGRGEMTAVAAVAAFGFVAYNGIIDRPGDPPGLIDLSPGWFVSLLGTILIFYGAARRSGETERRRKPPGVL